MNILVTGGTGTLGRYVVRTALGAGHGVRVQSRRSRPKVAPRVEWRQADLASGDGVLEAVVGAGAIIHAAHNPRKPKAVDVGGTEIPGFVALRCQLEEQGGDL